MENLSIHDAASTPHVLAPYAARLLEEIRGKFMEIPGDVKNDPSTLGAFFQRYHDIALGLLKDQEFNFADLQRVQEGIEELRQQITAQLGQNSSRDASEAA